MHSSVFYKCSWCFSHPTGGCWWYPVGVDRPGRPQSGKKEFIIKCVIIRKLLQKMFSYVCRNKDISLPLLMGHSPLLALYSELLLYKCFFLDFVTHCQNSLFVCCLLHSCKVTPLCSSWILLSRTSTNKHSYIFAFLFLSYFNNSPRKIHLNSQSTYSTGSVLDL